MKNPKSFCPSPAPRRMGRIYLYLAMVLGPLLFACRKSSLPADPDAALTNTLSRENILISNSDFSTDVGTGIVKDWTTINTSKGPIAPAKDGIQFSGDLQGNYYVVQRVGVSSGTFYKLSITADYTLNDYTPGGIYAMDTAMQTVLGKFEKVYSSATGDKWQFVFYSGTHTQIAVVVGFLDGINGSVRFTGATMEEYAYQPAVVNSDFAGHLSQRFPLLFTAQQFDSTVAYLGDYVNDVLLCKIRFLEDAGEDSILDALIGTDSAYTYFNQYRHQPDQVEDGYCQRSSLSLGEILTNEFHIPVRQIFMNFAGVGKHQFQEYWNPFSNKWIIIDPCFSVQYVKNNILLGDIDFTRTEAPSLMVRFGTHYFYAALDDLLALWQGYDELSVQGYYQQTYPY